MRLAFLKFDKQNINPNIGGFPPQENGDMQEPDGTMQIYNRLQFIEQKAFLYINIFVKNNCVISN